MQVDEFLTKMVECGGSDAHLKVGMPPGVRISGVIRPQGKAVLTPEHTQAIARGLLNDEQWRMFEERGDFDCSHSIAGVARFRVNILRQRGSISIVMRYIPTRIPSMEELGLPKICEVLARRPRGIVLVTGPTSSGKSTTLASMIDLINSTQQGHILTMEDPVEFLHSDKNCYINQREIGTDTLGFNEALRCALRQDPDVILIGEMRDLETISLAVTAAETGHLVLATLHTTSAIKTIDRVVNVFPPEQQTQIRMQVAGTLQGIISQILVPKIGGGQQAVFEILTATDAVRSVIRENKLPQLASLMQSGKQYGMQMLEDNLNELVAARKITFEHARAKANSAAAIKHPAVAQQT